MTLPTYRPDASCPKCGDARVGTHHISVGGDYACQKIDCYSKGAARVDCGSVRCHGTCIEEHLHRSCSRCHFIWPEAVLSP